MDSIIMNYIEEKLTDNLKKDFVVAEYTLQLMKNYVVKKILKKQKIEKKIKEMKKSMIA